MNFCFLISCKWGPKFSLMSTNESNKYFPMDKPTDVDHIDKSNQ